MAKDKERSINPAQQQRKVEKAKALKKGRAELQARRNEKLARRNPGRIQRQIDDLKALEAAGEIKPRETSILADLERDLRAVTKARQALGQTAPEHTARNPGTRREGDRGSVLGKRQHNGTRKPPAHTDRRSSGSDTDASTRNIPWPGDTPPPVPREFRQKRNAEPTVVPFGERSYPQPQPTQAKTTYASGPQLRDLKKEAVSRFVPTVVKRKQDAVRGARGQLLEPEELDSLEREGYAALDAGGDGTSGSRDAGSGAGAAPAAEGSHVIDDQELNRLKEEEERFERELALQGQEDGEADSDIYAPSHATALDNDPSNSREGATPQTDLPHHPSVGARLQPSRQVEMEEVEDEDM